MEKLATNPAVVAGHICLDIIPELSTRWNHLKPGSLVEAGEAVISVGGVCNTAIALHKLGLATRFVGRVGDDPFGSIVQQRLNRHGPELMRGIKVATGDRTSYSIVINPTDADRMFLHCPGANDRFSSIDVADDDFAGASWFHFGYPPLMEQIRANAGEDLAALLRRVRWAGVPVSLDMCSVDPASAAGRVDWPRLLRNVLPNVDLFAPSLDEMLFMLRSTDADPDLAGIDDLAARLLDMGASIVALKLGDKGLYLRTGDTFPNHLPLSPAWRNRQLLAPCFAVKMAGATGAGDCTIAGLVRGMLHHLPPTRAMEIAVAVGACCVEVPDATGGIVGLAAVQERIGAGWQRVHSAPSAGWTPTDHGTWGGPEDSAAS